MSIILVFRNFMCRWWKIAPGHFFALIPRGGSLLTNRNGTYDLRGLQITKSVINADEPAAILRSMPRVADRAFLPQEPMLHPDSTTLGKYDEGIRDVRSGGSLS